MPHSPYTQTVLPRLSDTVLDEDRQALQRARVDVDQGVNDKYAQCSTLEIAEELLEHIDYLDGKISAKKRDYTQLKQVCDELEEQMEVMNAENKALKDEAVALKAENKALKENAARLKAELESVVAKPTSIISKESNLDNENPPANDSLGIETQPEMVLTDPERRDGKRKAQNDNSVDEHPVKKVK